MRGGIPRKPYRRTVASSSGETRKPRIVPKTAGRTAVRGSDEGEYEIYRSNAASLGWTVKSYEEWRAT